MSTRDLLQCQPAAAASPTPHQPRRLRPEALCASPPGSDSSPPTTTRARIPSTCFRLSSLDTSTPIVRGSGLKWSKCAESLIPLGQIGAGWAPFRAFQSLRGRHQTRGTSVWPALLFVSTATAASNRVLCRGLSSSPSMHDIVGVHFAVEPRFAGVFYPTSPFHLLNRRFICTLQTRPNASRDRIRLPPLTPKAHSYSFARGVMSPALLGRHLISTI